MGYTGRQRGLAEQTAERVAAVTPSDAADLPEWAAALDIGTGGDVRITTWAGDVHTFRNRPSGSVLPVKARRVWATGTTAQDIAALY